MKKNYLLLLIIPICFLFFSIHLRSIEGPYYNYDLSDPSYVYLINSLSLAEMNGVYHVDHPGTTLQSAGAIIIKVYYYLSHEKDGLAEDVFYRPESYIKAINSVLIFLNMIGLFIIGMIIYKVKGNIFIALLFQTIPFVSINVSEVFSLVKTETFAFFLIAVVIALAFKLVYDNNASSDKYKFYIISFGILCGAILITKISFLCIILLPLILIDGRKQKLLFLGVTFLTFLILIVPALSNAEYFLSWVGKLFLNDGRYGKGDPDVLNTGTFFNNIAKIIVNEKFFAIVFLAFFIFVVSLFIKRKNTGEGVLTSTESKFAVAVFLAMLLQVILVAKHYSHRYMYPALILTIPALYILVTVLYKKYLSRVSMNVFWGIVFSLTALFCIYNVRKLNARTKTNCNESAKVEQFIKNQYPQTPVILSSGTTNPYTGLALAYIYSGENVKGEFGKYINTRFPGQMWYDIFSDRVTSIDNSIEMKTFFRPGRKLLFETTDDVYNAAFLENLKTNHQINNAKLEKVFSNENGELIYELTF